MQMSEFDQPTLEKASELLRAVAHQLRLNIIKLLDAKGEINVNEIFTSLKLEQSITSQHLKILRAADVVNTRRDGKMIYYSLNYDTISAVEKGITQFDAVTKERIKKRKQAQPA